MECKQLCGALECAQKGFCQAATMAPIPKRFIGADRFRDEAEEHLKAGRIGESEYQEICAMEDVPYLQTFGGEVFEIREREETITVYACIHSGEDLTLDTAIYPIENIPLEVRECIKEVPCEVTYEGNRYKVWQLTQSRGYPLCRIYQKGKLLQGNANDRRRVFRGEEQGKHRLYSFFSYPMLVSWLTDFRNDPYV